MLVDTDFLVALLRKDSTAIKKLDEISRTPEGLFITHVNRWELYKGAYLSNHPKGNLDLCNELFAFFSLLPFNQDIDHRFGQLHAQSIKTGTPIGTMDALIAAVALEYGQALLTRNARHFQQTGVQLVSW